MVYGTIIRRDEKYYTFLRKLFSAIGNKQLDYSWLISNHECYPADSDIQRMLEGNYRVLSGEELTEMINREDFQWIWGTFSAFPPNVTETDILTHPLPENDMYEGFWRLPLTIQHPKAQMEIVAFDSSYTLIFSRDFSLLETLRKTYPQAEDLAELIARDWK